VFKLGLKQLIEKCKVNDTQAQSELYKLFSGKLFSVCLKYSRNYAEAEDNLQDAFLTIFEKVGQFKHKGSFEGWLKRITVNTVLQRYRHEKVFDIIADDIVEDNEIEIDEDNISIDYLLQIIQELPNRYRLVFNLYVLDGYSHNDIANMLDINIGTSKSNLARARQILKTTIENYKTTKSLQSLQ
jgi:RNA polymerase sigma factor (sigma-70 family)